LYRPIDGLIPVPPQHMAGILQDPIVSDPSPHGAIPEPIPAPVPEEDPPEFLFKSNGFRTKPWIGLYPFDE